MFNLVRVLLAMALASFCAVLQAQDYPTKAVRLVVTVAPGGGLDALCRATAQRLSENWGQPVLVENRAGGQSIIGYEFVARAAPDGYTLLCSGPSQVTNSILSSNLSYDPSKDFAPVTGLVATILALVVNPSLPAKSIGELIELAKSKPGQLNYGSFGIGTSGHLITEMFASMGGVKLNHIPYKGGAPALADVVAGHSQMLFGAIGLVLPLWKAGKVRMLAVTSAKRLVQYPDVPTVAEAGLLGFEGSGWFGLNAPRATPRPVINKVNAEVQKIYGDAAFRARNLDPQGYESIVNSPEWFADYLKSDALKWEKVVRDAKIKID
ncbi:MAG: Bug family tripartite tricarboxylate transporter substrate binding protein [Burkholderiales bacterium]